MKKKILKYVGIFIVLLGLLIGCVLALLPTLVKQQATKYYAQAVPDGVLTIDDVGINLFTGKLLLKGVNATSKQNNVLDLGQFNVELSIKDLLSKNIHVQTLKLSDFDVLIERKGNQITVAGYTLPNAQADKDEKSEPLSLKSMGIEQLNIQNVELTNIRATLKGQHLNTNGVVKSLILKNIHSNSTEPAHLKANVQLNKLALKPSSQNPLTATLNQPAVWSVNATINRLFDNPSAKINSKLTLKALSLNNDQTQLTVDQPINLVVDANIKDALTTPKADVKAQLNVRDFALNNSDVNLNVEQPAQLTVKANLTNILKDPNSDFDLNLNLPSVRYEANGQRIQSGVDALKLNGSLSNVLTQVSLLSDVTVQKLKWDVQLGKDQSFVGESESISVPKLTVALGEKRAQEWLKGVPLKTLKFSKLNVAQLQNKAKLPSLVSDVALNTLSVDGFDVLDANAHAKLKADVLVNALEYDLGQKGKQVSIAPNAQLVIQADITKLNAPSITADAQLSKLVVNAKGFGEPLVRLDQLKVDHLHLYDVKNPKMNVQNIDVNPIVMMGGTQPLLKLATHVHGVAFKNNQLTINDVVLKNIASNITFAPKYRIAKIEKLIHYFASNKKAGKKAAQTSKHVPPQSEFKTVIKSIHTTGNNVVRIKDASLQPAIDHELTLKKVDIKNINTGNTQASTAFDVDVNLGKYSNVALAGDYTLFAKAPTGEFKGKLDNIDLLNYNTYLAQFVGYKAKTGALSMDVDVAVKKAELSGGVDVLLNNLNLSPSNPDRIASLKKQLSMPLDQSLSLLKDKQGKINVNLPLSGNINAPNFSLSGVMTLVTKKALKTATMIGLKQMIQPYGSLLTIGEWAGDKLLAVKLDPIEYGYGETQVEKSKIPYLEKVVEIMKAKEALNLKLCAKISQEEAEFAMLKPEELLPIANERSEKVRAYLVEKGGLPAGRILQCESEVSKKDKPYSWLDLEI